ncbi:MAG: hypothetical protein EBR82_14335 [Caulobacteraceae bacterium]|nr:hypothetical protein [Caulobacteraceae bacterium]
MSDSVPMLSGKVVDANGYRVRFELKNVPVQFANAFRRTLLNEMPVVEVADVNIVTNTTLMPHEMLKLRTELLPVNVRPTEEDVIRTTKLTLRAEGTHRLYSSDFVASGSRSDILLTDRDLGTPLYFLKTKEGESVHITASLRVNPLSSHCCVATYSFHIDEERAVVDKDRFIADNPELEDAEQLFDSFYKQRSYSRNELDRPNWFDMVVESIGAVPARDIAKDAFNIVKKNVQEWTKNDVIHEKEENVYQVVTESGGHTVGALVQAMLYDSRLCSFVSYDVPHPLRSEMKIRFLTEKTPADIMSYVFATITEWCDSCVAAL